ncbi:hypothetical protein PVAG01_05425 [Phlyctema vagabunda]|uniref:Uncharacterized protein n=1 Tax=Phlyctema vagabunda TaxID=108571 RepID=A0ABR4PK20_9HELO
MRDARFYTLVMQISDRISPTEPKFESRLDSIMEERSSLSLERFEHQAYKILRAGSRELFQDESQQLDFLLALDKQHTVEGFEALLSDCVPALIDKLRGQSSDPRQRSLADACPSRVRTTFGYSWRD